MLSLKNLELLIVIRVRFRGAVPAAAVGPAAFAFGCCIAMVCRGGRRDIRTGSWPSSLARPVTENGERHSNHSSLVINLGCLTVIPSALELDTVGTPRAHIPLSLRITPNQLSTPSPSP